MLLLRHLYGSRAANGVIMITTKKAKRGLGVTVNSGVLVGKIDKTTMPTYQKQYGAGYSDEYQKDGFLYFDVDGDGTKDYVVPTSEDASFGGKFDPNLMVYHWDAFDPASPYYQKATSLGSCCKMILQLFTKLLFPLTTM